MRNKINKNLILLIATVLLIVSLISAVSLGWFVTNERVYVETITASITAETNITITSDEINYIVPSGYDSGMAPGCLGYFTIRITNEEPLTDAYYSISVNFDTSVIPDNLQFYKGNWSTSDNSLPADHNTKWSSANYISNLSGLQPICSNNTIEHSSYVDYNVAFFWPYSSPDNNSQDNTYGLGGRDFTIQLTLNTVAS